MCCKKEIPHWILARMSAYGWMGSTVLRLGFVGHAAEQQRAVTGEMNLECPHRLTYIRCDRTLSTLPPGGLPCGKISDVVHVPMPQGQSQGMGRRAWCRFTTTHP